MRKIAQAQKRGFLNFSLVHSTLEDIKFEQSKIAKVRGLVSTHRVIYLINSSPEKRTSCDVGLSKQAIRLCKKGLQIDSYSCADTMGIAPLAAQRIHSVFVAQLFQNIYYFDINW
jgi:hypothetical protein